MKDNYEITINEIQNRDCHLCGRCHNAEPSKCAKVADVHKKDIADYEFITNGYQVFDDFGKSNIFVVKSCKNFVPMADAHQTKKQAAKLRRLRGQIACGYFETCTPDEAYLLQVELFERGHLHINEKYLPNEKTINAIKQRVRK